MHSSNSEEIDVFNDNLGDEIESPEIFAKSISGTLQGNLTHSRLGQILLLAPWTTKFARRKFDMFPEFIGGDDTEGTNSEQRALYWATMVIQYQAARTGGVPPKECALKIWQIQRMREN